MDDLITFLAARLDEDEQVARKAMVQIAAEFEGTERTGKWDSGNIYLSDDGTPTSYEVWSDDDPDATVIRACRPLAVHIARHDPERVLADVAAKRRIIERCTTNVEYEGEPVADDVLRLLSLPYADHPDYREEFKP